MLEHPSILVNILIIVGESFWVVSAYSQLKKLRKTRNTKGLNAVSQTLNAAGNLSWATYFALNHLWFPFASNVVLFALSCSIIWYIFSNRKKFIQGLISIAIIGPTTSYVLLKNPSIGGWLGMLYNWIAATPQLNNIVRKKKVSGLSERGILFAFGAMICVLLYALIIHSLPLIIGCTQALIYEIIIYRFYKKYRHKD